MTRTFFVNHLRTGNRIGKYKSRADEELVFGTTHVERYL